MANPSTLITGVPELAAKLAHLKQDTQARTAKRAVGAAAAVIRNQAKANINAQGLVLSGTLLRNVVFKYERKPPADGVFAANVGVRHGRGLLKKDKANTKLVLGANGRIVKRYVDDPYYFRFLEKGTVKLPAQPFLGPALQDKQQEAIDAMRKVLEKAIIKQEASP